MVSSEETASTTAAPAVIERYFHGVNNEDWADFKGIWHDDAVVEVVGGIRVQGWDAIQPYYVGALQNFPVHYDDPYRVHVAGDTITVEIAFTGETVDGVPTTFEAVDVFTIEDGLVRRLTTWYDLDRVLKFARTPGTPERRLRTLVRHAAAASPFYRSRFEELGLDADAVAADLTLLPVTGLDGVTADELVAVPPRAVTHVCARGAEAVPLSRADLAERGRIWAEALALAGVGRGDTVMGLEPSPGLAEGVAQAKAQLAFAIDAAVAGATVVIHVVGAPEVYPPRNARVLTVLEPPATGIVASSCSAGTMHAHTGAHVVEIVDGKLVLTPLGARAWPLLRWTSGIEASWLDGPCSCGSELPRLELHGAAQV